MASRRILMLVALGAIVAVAALAVYLLAGRSRPPQKLGGIDNFISAREVLPAPLTPFMDEHGARVTLERFRGKVVVLNLWATWCTPCVAEMPMLDRLQQQLEGTGVVVVALSLDAGGPATVKAFFEEHGIKHLGIYVDPTMSAQSAFRVIGLPTTILIDREGRDVGRVVGPAEWDNSRAADLVLSVGGPSHMR